MYPLEIILMELYDAPGEHEYNLIYIYLTSFHHFLLNKLYNMTNILAVMDMIKSRFRQQKT